MATYSLANYIVAVSDIISNTQIKSFEIGGSGSMTDSISIQRTNNTFETSGDPTGGYVHNKSYDMTGTVQITLSQLAARVQTLKTLVNIYTQATYINTGLTIVVSDSQGNDIVKCSDCVPQGIPEQRFEGSAGTQTWQFNCGKIEFL